MMFVAEKYEYTADKTFKVYSFISYGPKGAIHKIARFNEIYGDIYNFGFGDYDITSGEFSDTKVSNNEDMSIIMGTLGSIIYDFTNVFPNARVMIRGTNTARTHLYQMRQNRFGWGSIGSGPSWSLYYSLYRSSSFMEYRWKSGNRPSGIGLVQDSSEPPISPFFSRSAGRG